MSNHTAAEVAISRAIAAYPAFVDVADLPNIKNLFTEDVVFSYGNVTLTGRDQLLEMFATAAIGIHLAGAPYITVDDDGAAATASVQFFYIKDGSQAVVRGTYRDRLRLEDGAWRFSRRVIEIRPGA